jgi:apolipoprotein N-acyltransferase
VSLVAGAVTSLAFPPHSATWLVWIALVPWLIGLDRVSLVGTGLVSIVFALGLCLPLGGWIPDTAAGGFGADPLGAYGLWVATSASFAPAIALLKVLLRGLSIRSPVFALAAGAGWGLVELSFGRIWPTIPYVTLGATQIETPIAAMAEVLGAHGVSAVVAAANALVAQAMLLRKLRVLIPASALAAVVLLIAVVPPSEPARGGALRVALVQPAVPLTGPPDSRFQHDNLEALIALTRDCPASLPS